jgi:hypothetical protein
VLHLRRVLLALVVTAGAVVVSPGFSGQASASNPIHPDNRPSTVAGQTNGSLSPTLLRHASPTCQVFRDAAPSLISMLHAARRDGVILSANECFRDYAGQVAMREHWCGRNACHMAAVPGTSNHGWGKAVDFRDQDGGLHWESRGYKWLKANAGRFGWNHPGVMGPTGSVPEPWHWEWVGDGGRMFPGVRHGIGNGIGLPVDGWPQGSLDNGEVVGVTGWSGRVRVAGWTIDPNTAASIDTHVWINWKDVAAVKANKPRADVAELLAGYAASPHGYDSEIPVMYGQNRVCAFGIDDTRPGGNNLLGCRTIEVGTTPIGSFDSIGVVPGGARVRGWAIDANTPDSVQVEVHVNGVLTASAPADAVRADVTSIFAGHPMPGFDLTVPLPHGKSTVCAWAINVGPGVNHPLGCRDIESNRNPFGSFDAASATTNSIELTGWTIDPDTTGAIPVHVYVDGKFAGAPLADRSRPDVGTSFPGFGNNHGFVVSVPAAKGPRTACVFAINVGGGNDNPLLGCRTVTV